MASEFMKEGRTAMSQMDEEAILKSARFLYKSGYTDEAKAVLVKLNTPQALALLGKMSGSTMKTETNKRGLLPWFAWLMASVAIAILAFGLGWILAPKSQETLLLDSINEEIQVEDGLAATATIESFQATRSTIEDSNEIALTQIHASATAAVQAATATAEASEQ
jgi:hypothetical protein